MSSKISKEILRRNSRMLKLHNNVIIGLVSRQIQILEELEKSYSQLQFSHETSLCNISEPNLKSYNTELLIFQLVAEYNSLESQIDNLRRINSTCQE